MKTSAIYKIQSLIKPERCYIGSAININHRLDCHLYDLRNNRHNNKLQRHFNKYGESDLEFSIIEPCLPEFLTGREQYYIDILKPYFNILPIAGSSLGYKHTEETKNHLKLKRALREPDSKETREKKSESLKGHPNYLLQHSEESKKKISNANKGMKVWNKGLSGIGGWKLSDEVKQKMSLTRKGKRKDKPISEETKIKIGNATRGKTNFFKGKKRSEETKRKMSEAKLLWYQIRKSA